MGIYILMGLSIALAIALCIMYWLLATRAAAAHLCLFLAEAFTIRNFAHPRFYPHFAFQKALENTDLLRFWYRPISVWYIKRRGYRILGATARYLQEDMENDKRVSLKQ
jgi:hypothetical protein